MKALLVSLIILFGATSLQAAEEPITSLADGCFELLQGLQTMERMMHQLEKAATPQLNKKLGFSDFNVAIDRFREKISACADEK